MANERLGVISIFKRLCFFGCGDMPTPGRAGRPRVHCSSAPCTYGDRPGSVVDGIVMKISAWPLGRRAPDATPFQRASNETTDLLVFLSLFLSSRLSLLSCLTCYEKRHRLTPRAQKKKKTEGNARKKEKRNVKEYCCSSQICSVTGMVLRCT